jgi:regulator of protease activity HflC (stomatin/prohibitin superfamily)
MREKSKTALPGLLMLVLCLSLVVAGVVVFGRSAATASRLGGQPETAPMVTAALLVIFGVIGLRGVYVQAPNEGKVLQLFGRYVGTTRADGLLWNNPLFTRASMSLRVRNFESARLKVNDIEGNPIEIAAIVVWKVIDTAQASFDVDNFTSFVQVQTESAVRTLATHHPYDAHDERQLSLRGNTDAIAEQLKREISARVGAAGVEIIEARIAHLAYAQEIAQAMLQRQQAGAIIAARTRIVEGAVSMVEMALQQLAVRGVVELDAERKAQMVSNLLVVLCGERNAQPVINAGTLY